MSQIPSPSGRSPLTPPAAFSAAGAQSQGSSSSSSSSVSGFGRPASILSSSDAVESHGTSKRKREPDALGGEVAPFKKRLRERNSRSAREPGSTTSAFSSAVPSARVTSLLDASTLSTLTGAARQAELERRQRRLMDHYSALHPTQLKKELGVALQVNGPMPPSAIDLRRAQIAALIAGAKKNALSSMETVIEESVPAQDTKQAELQMGKQLRQWALQLVYERLYDGSKKAATLQQGADQVLEELQEMDASIPFDARWAKVEERICALYEAFSPEERALELQRLRDRKTTDATVLAGTVLPVDARERQLEALFRSMRPTEIQKVVACVKEALSWSAQPSELGLAKTQRWQEVRALFKNGSPAQQIEWGRQILDESHLLSVPSAHHDDATKTINFILTPMAQAMHVVARAATLQCLRDIDRMAEKLNRGVDQTVAATALARHLLNFGLGCDRSTADDLRHHAIDLPYVEGKSHQFKQALFSVRWAEIHACLFLTERSDCVKLVGDLLQLWPFARMGIAERDFHLEANTSLMLSVYKAAAPNDRQEILDAMVNPARASHFDEIAFEQRVMPVCAAQWRTLASSIAPAERNALVERLKAQRSPLLAGSTAMPRWVTWFDQAIRAFSVQASGEANGSGLGSSISISPPAQQSSLSSTVGPSSSSSSAVLPLSTAFASNHDTDKVQQSQAPVSSDSDEEA